MTGFGAAEDRVLNGRLRVEIRTVNHRYFNPQLKLPADLAGIESEMRVLSAQALDAFEQANDGAVDIVKGQMRRLVIDLAANLPADFPPCRIGDLRRHIGFHTKAARRCG